MGKKHHLKEMAKRNIKILGSSKIKLKRGQKINIKPYVEDSVEGSIVSRLGGIISEKMGHEERPIKSEATLIDQYQISSILGRTKFDNDTFIPTIVVTTTKKNSIIFDFAGDNIIGNLLRTSTLGPIYEKIKSEWKKLNTDDKSDFTNILYIPNILVFSDGMESLFNPYKVNLLLVSVPTYKTIKEGLSDEDLDNSSFIYLSRVYGDIMDAATKINGCDNLVIDPFTVKTATDNIHTVVQIWNYLINSKRCKENIDSIWFSVDNEYDYVIFIAEKGIVKKSSIPTNENDEEVVHENDTKEEYDDSIEDIKDEIISDIKENTEKKKKTIKKKLEEQADLLDD